MLIFKRDVWPSFTFNNYKKPNFLNWLLSAKDATKLLSKDEKVIDMKLYSSTFPFFGAFNVHSLALSAPLHSVRADCSQSAHSAFTLRSPFVQHSLIAQSVIIHFHSDLQNEIIGLCESQQNE